MAPSWQSVSNCHQLSLKGVLDKCMEYGTDVILFTGSHEDCKQFRATSPSSVPVDATSWFSRDPMSDKEKKAVNRHKTSFTHDITYDSFKMEEKVAITQHLERLFTRSRSNPFVADIHCLAGLHRSQAGARSFGDRLMCLGFSVCVINYGTFHRYWCDPDYSVLLGFPEAPKRRDLGKWAEPLPKADGSSKDLRPTIEADEASPRLGAPDAGPHSSTASKVAEFRRVLAEGKRRQKAEQEQLPVQNPKSVSLVDLAEDEIKPADKSKAAASQDLRAEDFGRLQKIVSEAWQGSAQVHLPQGVPVATWTKFTEANAQRMRRRSRHVLQTTALPECEALTISQCKLLINELGLKDGEPCDWLCYSGCGRIVVKNVADPPTIPKFCCLACMDAREGHTKHARHCECKCGPGRRQPRIEVSFQAKSLELVPTELENTEADFDNKEQTEEWLFETAQLNHWNEAVVEKRKDLLTDGRLRKIDERLTYRGEAGGPTQEKEKLGNARVEAALAKGKPPAMKPMCAFLSDAQNCDQLLALQHKVTENHPLRAAQSSRDTAQSSSSKASAAQTASLEDPEDTEDIKDDRSAPMNETAIGQSKLRAASTAENAERLSETTTVPSFDAPPRESPRSIAFAACGFVKVDAADCSDSHTFSVQTAFELYQSRAGELVGISVDMGNVYGVFVFHFFDAAAREEFEDLCRKGSQPHQGLAKLYSTECDAECVKFSTLANSALRLAVGHGADWTTLLSLRDAFSSIPVPNDALDEIFDHHNTSSVVLYLPGGGFGCRLATWSWAWHQSGFLEEQYRNAPTLRVQCELLARSHGMHVHVLKDSGDPGIGYAPTSPGRCRCIDGSFLNDMEAREAIASLGMDFEEECLSDLELMHRDQQRLQKTPRNNTTSPAQGFHTRRMLSSIGPHRQFSDRATIEPQWTHEDAVVQASHPCTRLWTFLHERDLLPFNAPAHSRHYEKHISDLLRTRPAKREVRVPMHDAHGVRIGYKKLKADDPSLATVPQTDVKLAKGSARSLRKARTHARKLLEEGTRNQLSADASVKAPERMQ